MFYYILGLKTYCKSKVKQKFQNHLSQNYDFEFAKLIKNVTDQAFPQGYTTRDVVSSSISLWGIP